MNPLKLTESQLIELWREENFIDDNDKLLFEVVEEGDWKDEGKFQDLEVIFKDVNTGKFYAFNIQRSGSYFSHYEYEVWDSVSEVEKQTKTVVVERWVAI